MPIRIVFFKGNQTPAFAHAAMIRETVFLQEQQFTVDFDEIDAYAWHAVVYDGDIPAATGRFFTDEQGVHHIGRIAVQKAYRQQGVGSYLMRELEQFAAEHGADSITLGAQIRVSEFYRKLGYVPYGEIFYDEYCEHISMRKQL